MTAGKTAVHTAGGTHLYIDGADCRGSASFGVNPTAGPVTNCRIMRETRGLMPRPAGHVTVQAMSEGPQGISPVTEVFTWRVSQGKQGEFESWAHGITGAAAKFEGHLGAAWLRSEGEGNRYHTVVRFTSAHLLAKWLHSPERAQWIRQLKGIATKEVARSTGMETWFSLPGQAVSAPPKWKMAVVTFCAIWPISILFDGLVAPSILGWPLPVRAAVFPLALVPLLTFLIMPNLSRLLRHWLYSVV